MEDIPADASHADQKRRLFEEFGSKKKKQTLRAADRNRIDIDKAGSAAAMDLAVRSGQKAAEKEAQAPTKHILPSYDLNATDPDKIYELSSSRAVAVAAVGLLGGGSDRGALQLCRTTRPNKWIRRSCWRWRVNAPFWRLTSSSQTAVKHIAFAQNA